MASGFGEPTEKPFGSSFARTSDIGDFECNICFDLAQDPILTLCGHLFCWPCLYKWLHNHAHSNDCPVCKALIEEPKLVPLYGRGKNSTDPRSKSQIPSRPSGQRPETAPQQGPSGGPQHDFGFMGISSRGSSLLRSLRSSEHGGLFHPLFSAQMHRNPADALYGDPARFHYEQSRFHYEQSRVLPSGHLYAFPRPINLERQLEFLYKLMVFVLAIAMVASFF